MKFAAVENTLVCLDESVHPFYRDAQYPRVKRMKDGRYMLVFQNGQLGGTIYTAFSGDLKNWTAPRAVLSSHHVRRKDGEKDIRLFMTADAVVLENGDILMACSYRQSDAYRTQVDGNGIVMMRSVDCGVTWSVPEIIYVGTNWEPHLLALRSGEIHMYFTHTAPKIHKYGFEQQRRSSGTALVRSLDGGFTWTPWVTGAPFEAQRVAQQYVTDVNGVAHYTDQMPVGTELKDGSIALSLESMGVDRLHYLSLAYTHDNWKGELAMDEDGPEDRQNFLHPAAGPYLVTLSSGLTALCYNTGEKFFIRAGDETAHHFDEPVQFFTDFHEGHWSSLLALEDDQVVACFPQVTNCGKNIIGIQVLRLEK